MSASGARRCATTKEASPRTAEVVAGLVDDAAVK
jgi:hypothetical protein